MTKVSTRGTIPTDQDLADLLQTLSERHYNGEYIPNVGFYDMHRPNGWLKSKALLFAHGLPDTADGWRKLCSWLGLTRPVADQSVNILRAARERAAAPKPPSLGVELDDERTHTSAYAPRDGLPVIERMREVRVWCPRRHAYVPVGWRIVYEVR